MSRAADIDLSDEARFVLEALSEEPSLSQRQLARRVGLSVTKAHFVLKRLLEKGLVKVQNVARSKHKLGYLYVLTPKGLEAKARLTYRFLHRMAAHYQDLLERVEGRLQDAIDEAAASTGDGAPVRVAILGEGPLAEVVRDIVSVHPRAALVEDPEEADLGVVVDPDAVNGVSVSLEMVSLA